MAGWVFGALRTGAQALWGILVARAADAGIVLPDWMQGWFVETLMVGGAIALVTAGIRWLETRKGDSFGARAARWIARVVMLGLSAKQPVYTKANDEVPAVSVKMGDGSTQRAQV
jgi:hypothetical protein